MMLVGAFTAGVQVVRGVVRAGGLLVAGDPRGALAQAAGGLAAPLVSAYTQLCRLGEDACHAAHALAEKEEEPDILSFGDAVRNWPRAATDPLDGKPG
jgi:hypothetical protein